MPKQEDYPKRESIDLWDVFLSTWYWIVYYLS